MLTLLTIAKECERGTGSTSTGTGKRADPREKRRDRRSRRGSSRYRWVGVADSFGSL